MKEPGSCSLSSRSRAEHAFGPAPRQPLGPAHGERRAAPPFQLLHEPGVRLRLGSRGRGLGPVGFQLAHAITPERLRSEIYSLS
jgi:hypothetical protein